MSGPSQPIRLRMTATMSGPPARPIRKVTDEPGSFRGRLPSTTPSGDPDEHGHDGRLGQPLPRFAGVLGECVDGFRLSDDPELVPELHAESRPRRELHAGADDAGHDQSIGLRAGSAPGRLLPLIAAPRHDDPSAGDFGARPGEVDGKSPRRRRTSAWRASSGVPTAWIRSPIQILVLARGTSWARKPRDEPGDDDAVSDHARRPG